MSKLDDWFSGIIKGWMVSTGSAAHDAAANGNPVQAGGVYRATDPTLSDGDAGSIRLNSKGEVITQVSGSNTRHLSTATITIGTGAAHSAGDVVSTDAGAILTFATGLPAGSSGIILDSIVKLAQNAVFSGGAGYTLYLFNALPTVQATNAAFDLVDADLAAYIGKITISTLQDLGSNCAVTNVGHNLSFNLAEADTNIYGKAVCNGGETTVSGKVLSFGLGIAAI